MNSKFLTRLLYYLTGFGIGILMVFVLFQNRACNWTPQNRIKQDIKNRIIVVNEGFKADMEKRGITKSMVMKVLDKGSIDYSSSQKHEEPKAYNIYDKQLKLNFTIPFNSFISEISVGFDEAKNIHNSNSGLGDLFIFPDVENLLYVDDITSKSVVFQEIGSPKNSDIVEALKKNGQIDFSKSDFDLRPNASQFIICTINGTKIGMKAVWYKDKINVYSMEFLYD